MADLTVTTIELVTTQDGKVYLATYSTVMGQSQQYKYILSG